MAQTIKTDIGAALDIQDSFLPALRSGLPDGLTSATASRPSMKHASKLHGDPIPGPREDPKSRAPNSGLQQAYSVDYWTLKNLLFGSAQGFGIAVAHDLTLRFLSEFKAKRDY